MTPKVPSDLMTLLRDNKFEWMGVVSSQFSY
jgi:hypothetical protein